MFQPLLTPIRDRIFTPSISQFYTVIFLRRRAIRPRPAKPNNPNMAGAGTLPLVLLVLELVELVLELVLLVLVEDDVLVVELGGGAV